MSAGRILHKRMAFYAQEADLHQEQQQPELISCDILLEELKHFKESTDRMLSDSKPLSRSQVEVLSNSIENIVIQINVWIIILKTINQIVYYYIIYLHEYWFANNFF